MSGGKKGHLISWNWNEDTVNYHVVLTNNSHSLEEQSILLLICCLATTKFFGEYLLLGPPSNEKEQCSQCCQVKSPVPMDFILLNHWLRGPTSKCHRLLPWLLVTLYNLTVRPYLEKHYVIREMELVPN